jgi:hypothetical protein
MLITIVVVATLALACLRLGRSVAPSPSERGGAVGPGLLVLEGRWPLTETLGAASAVGVLVAIAVRGSDSAR